MKKFICMIICCCIYQGSLLTYAYDSDHNENAEKSENDSGIEIVTEDTYQPVDLSTMDMMENASMGHHVSEAQSFSTRAVSPYWKNENGIKSFYDATGSLFVKKGTKKIIDVSEHNGTIDWEKVKASGVDGAIIRIGYGYWMEDKQFKRNIAECNRLRIPYGLYLYSYAYDANFAYAEAEGTAEMLAQVNVNLTYPIFYDIENFNSWTHEGVVRYHPTTPSEYEKVILTYINRMNQLGYKNNVYVYSYRSYLQNQLNSKAILSHVSWVAAYTSTFGFKNPYYQGDLGWQYTSDGSVDGIGGRVDISCFSGNILSTTPTAIKLTPSTVTLYPDDTFDMNAVVSPTAVNAKLTWRIENEKVAKVDQNGVITAVGEGNTYVYAKTWNEIENRALIKVERRFSENSKMDPTNNIKATTLGVNKVKVTWDPVPYADGYIIYRKNDENKFSYLYMVKGNEYTDESAKFNTYNFYKVYAYKMVNGKRILGSSPTYAYAKPYVPGVKDLTSVPSGMSSVRLTWSDVGEVDGYKIYRQEADGNFVYYDTVKEASYSDPFVEAGKYYFYRVYGYKNENGKEFTGKAGNYVYATPRPLSIYNLRAAKMSNYIRITWNSASDVDGYIIYRQAPGESKMTYRYMVKNNYFNDIQLSKSGYYFYRVYAYKMVNGKRVLSNSDTYVYAKK